MTSTSNYVFDPRTAVRHLTSRAEYNGAVSPGEFLNAIVEENPYKTRILAAKAGLVNSDVQQAHVVACLPIP